MSSDSTIFLFDVDNTLLDNDAVVDELCRYLVDQVGQETADLYWKHFEALNSSLGYANYLGALQRARDDNTHDMRLLGLSRFFTSYPFHTKLLPKALDVIAHVRRWGVPVLLSDGDIVFQPAKIQKAGLCSAFEDRILIYKHKEQELQDVERHYPALHYVLIDDRLSILTAAKDYWRSRVTTVHVKQGSFNEGTAGKSAPADITLERIQQLLAYTREDLGGPVVGANDSIGQHGIRCLCSCDSPAQRT